MPKLLCLQQGKHKRVPEPLRQLKAALALLHGAREGSPFMTEQLGVDER